MEGEKKPEKIHLGDSAALKRALDDAAIEVNALPTEWYSHPPFSFKVIKQISRLS
jgi:hypothetical protein